MDVWRPLEHAVCAEKTEMILIPCPSTLQKGIFLKACNYHASQNTQTTIVMWPLQRIGHMGQKHLAVWHTMQWAKNKEISTFVKLVSFLFKVPSARV